MKISNRVNKQKVYLPKLEQRQAFTPTPKFGVTSRSKGGFTLIELLVVIAVIGLLATIVTVSVNNTRKKARDAQRIASIKQIQTALELYYDQYGSYPPRDGSWAYDCSGNTSLATVLNGLVTNGYLPQVPHDPRYSSNPWPYCFYYITNYNPGGLCGSPGTTTYLILSAMETTTYNLPVWTAPGSESPGGRYCFFAK